MELTDVKEVPELNTWLKERDLRGYWANVGARPPELKPHLWKWDHIYQGMIKAAEVVSMEQTFRRNIGLVNPSLGAGGSTNISLGLQAVMPGEYAGAHRHSAAAIRFVVMGAPGAYTVVEGEPMPQEAGDLITTPHWTWHDHYNDSKEPAMWLDCLDGRLAHLGREFREDYPTDQQPRDKPVGYSARMLGAIKPTWIKSEHRTPPFRYAWTDTYATLMTLKQSETEADPCDGYHLMYTHPLTGGPTLPTIACAIQLFTPHQKGEAHRHNCTTIYQAFRGSGVSIIDGERFEWSQGDMFIVPPWSLHEHENPSSADAVLFSVSDWPAIEALGLYKEGGIDPGPVRH